MSTISENELVFEVQTVPEAGTASSVHSKAVYHLSNCFIFLKIFNYDLFFLEFRL